MSELSLPTYHMKEHHFSGSLICPQSLNKSNILPTSPLTKLCFIFLLLFYLILMHLFKLTFQYTTQAFATCCAGGTEHTPSNIARMKQCLAIVVLVTILPTWNT